MRTRATPIYGNPDGKNNYYDVGVYVNNLDNIDDLGISWHWLYMVLGYPISLYYNFFVQKRGIHHRIQYNISPWISGELEVLNILNLSDQRYNPLYQRLYFHEHDWDYTRQCQSQIHKSQLSVRIPTYFTYCTFCDTPIFNVGYVETTGVRPWFADRNPFWSQAQAADCDAPEGGAKVRNFQWKIHL